MSVFTTTNFFFSSNLKNKMANAQRNTFVETSFGHSEITDSDFCNEFAESQITKTNTIRSVQKEGPSNDVQVTLPSFQLIHADNNSCKKKQISLRLLFVIIVCSLIAIALTNIVTFFITKDTLHRKYYTCTSVLMKI